MLFSQLVCARPAWRCWWCWRVGAQPSPAHALACMHALLPSSRVRHVAILAPNAWDLPAGLQGGTGASRCCHRRPGTCMRILQWPNTHGSACVPLPSGAGISHERARGQASLVGCGVAHILCSVQSSSRRRALVGVSGQHSRVKICHLTDRKLQTLACADKSGLATRSEMWSLRQPRGCRSLVTGRVVLREL